jgi:RES domain
LTWNAFSDFEWSVRRDRRFWHSAETRSFLGTVLATSLRRARVLPADSELYRAQLGGRRTVNNRGGLVSEGPVEGPHGPERMKPYFDRAKEGRANPLGIPCLYLADNAATAITELRPWPGQYVTLGVFRTGRDLRVVDCAADQPSSYLEEPSPRLRENAVWGAINEAFARPVSRDDTSADYAPTQTLAEVFREHGYEGMRYRSSCGLGQNIALFNQLAADPIRCNLCTVDSIKYSWSWTAAIENHA